VTKEKGRFQKWAFVSELVASAAVVVSLVFLSYEVRENTRAIEGTAFQELIHASDASLLAVATDSALASIWNRGAEYDSLSPSDQARFFALTRVFWRNYENAYLQYRRGLINPEEWGVYFGLACESKSTSWALHRDAMTPSFVEVVETCQS